MKKYLLFCFVCCLSIAFFTSCEKENMDEMEFAETNTISEERFSDTLVTEYPTAIDEYIAQNHPDATIEEVYTDEEGAYLIVLTNDLYLVFDANGQFLEEIDEEDLHDCEEDYDQEDDYTVVTEYPTAIDEYLSQNYPDVTVEEVVYSEGEGYAAILMNDLIIVFDTEGRFIEEIDEEDLEEEREEEYTVVTEYPAAIDDYLSQNYPDVAVEKIVYSEGEGYAAILMNGLIIVFDTEGQFIEEINKEDLEKEEDYTVVTEYPAAIDDYLSQNHPDATVEKVVLLADGEYVVVLENDVYLIFDADGNFLKEERDDDDDKDDDDDGNG